MSDLLSALIDLFWWPYNAWKDGIESSRVGVSPDEKKTLRFWHIIAITATVVIAAIVVLGVLALHWIGGQTIRFISRSSRPHSLVRA